MSIFRFKLASSLVLIAASLCHASCYAASIFKDLPFEKAKSTAKDEGKYLIVDFTASWCGPCHKMEADTWSNSEVQKWINDNAVAVQVDVDKEHETSAAFGIQAMPSVVVFRPKDYAKEFDRHVGYMGSSDIMDWFKAVKNGETQYDAVKHAMEASIGKGGKLEVEARRKFGRASIEEGKFDAALEQYLWLWQNMVKEDPDTKTMRATSLSNEIMVLTKRNAAAKARFSQFRDESEKNDPLDFIVLNEVLGEPEKTLAWFDKVKNDPAEKENLKIAGRRLEKLLIQKGRWADMASIYPDPVEEVKLRSDVSKNALAALAKMGIRAPYDPFCMDSAKIYAAYLAVHKESLARKIAAECLKISDTSLMKQQLVLAALQAKEPRKEQLKWITDDKELTAKLEAALHPPKKNANKNTDKNDGNDRGTEQRDKGSEKHDKGSEKHDKGAEKHGKSSEKHD
ncbi:MAG: thioredoxin family protein [Candidatus Obscuribacterales bacterium]|nr:thioredoxin family protein [Candidatus Obscuribacterales bacterium]